MSLAIKYESLEDARLRLSNTIVRYKGEPVFIRSIALGEGGDDIFRVMFDEFPLKQEKVVAPKFKLDGQGMPVKIMNEEVKAAERKFISSKHFDISPFKMGYVNSARIGAYYCSRAPTRQQKQGLSHEAFRGITNEGVAVAWQTFLYDKGIRDMVIGKYPTIEEAAKQVREVSSVAFDREFALKRDDIIPKLLFLYYKGNKVGIFAEDKVTLGDRFMCLKETLEEKKLRVGAF